MAARAGGKGSEALLFLVALPCLAALVLAWLVPVANAWGWDESMHAELPAVRMLMTFQDVEPRAFFEALHSCGQYPFVWPLVLALAQATFGVGEAVARGAGWVAFALVLAFVHAGARELSRARAGSDPWAGRLAPFFALLSPLLCAFAPTLFLEVPSALAVSATFLAWLVWQRTDESSRAARRALLASGLATIALFTKWNYGVLLWLGLSLDLVQWIASAGSGVRRARARRALWLLPIPILALAWWFLAPLPFGAEVARAHRSAFVEFLGGNLEMASAPWWRRILDLIGYLPGSPLQAAVLLVGLVATLPRLRTSAVRTSWILLLALEVPAVAHPYHLDRFLIPGSPVLWMLAALGWSSLLERKRVFCVPLLAACLLGWLTAPWQFERAVRVLGEWPEAEKERAWAREVIAGWVHPDLRRRIVATAGLRREELENLLDALARGIGPTERVGWPAIPSEVSPAVLHLGLLARGGSRERFLAEAYGKMFLSIAQTDEGLSPEQVARWAEDYDVLILTDPPDLKARAGREWLRAHVAPLLASGRWEVTHVADLEITRPPSPPLSVQLELAHKRP